MTIRPARAALAVALLFAAAARADVGDPQVRTDHPWYPGELACSTFDRLAATEAVLYERVVGRKPATDEDKALAAWLWRCTHYYHGEEGAEDLWGEGFTKGADLRTREYWTGLFAHGFGLCGTTHAQWSAEMEALLGHGRGRCVGVAGHNSFEVFLTGGAYGNGKWALLDHDVCAVVFDERGSALLSIPEVRRDWKRLTDHNYKPERQHGWPVCGLHPDDGGVYGEYNSAEYLPGYGGPPPMVHLRRGERFRRYPRPGLEDGKTFVFWGRNYNAGGVPGPERSLTWVNQPEKMYRAARATEYHVGQARYGNAVYVYTPDFTSGNYREGVVEEDGKHVVFEFRTPYIIGATPPNNQPWGIYDTGGKNGLVLRGKADCPVAVSTDRGKTWQDCGAFRDGLDLTDRVKGHRQYLLRLGAGADALKGSGLTMTTVCQANAAVMPRLKDGGSEVRFEASGRALTSAGPTLPLAKSALVEGQFGTPRVTLEVSAPRGAPVVAVYAAAHVRSSNPPSAEVKYQIEASADGGKTWRPVVRDWTIPRRGDEPKDFWSQSLCWGSLDFPAPVKAPIRVRFRNDGGKAYARCEAHLAYRTGEKDSTKVTFAWSDDKGEHKADHTFLGEAWTVPTGREVRTRWVEFEAVPRWTGR
ncbi:MAG TPA: hypothetical protein VFW33_18150 [Gemmataceae bacterium]|nr:hypothetical protein [Gemmataceae bacterium]